MQTLTEPSVRIRSQLHPTGRMYPLIPVDALDAGRLDELTAVCRKAAALQRRERLGVRARWLIPRMVNVAVAAVLPDLEPEVLRRLPFESAVRVLAVWAELAAKEVRNV